MLVLGLGLLLFQRKIANHRWEQAAPVWGLPLFLVCTCQPSRTQLFPKWERMRRRNCVPQTSNASVTWKLFVDAHFKCAHWMGRLCFNKTLGDSDPPRISSGPWTQHRGHGFTQRGNQLPFKLILAVLITPGGNLTFCWYIFPWLSHAPIFPFTRKREQASGTEPLVIKGTHPESNTHFTFIVFILWGLSTYGKEN